MLHGAIFVPHTQALSTSELNLKAKRKKNGRRAFASRAAMNRLTSCKYQGHFRFQCWKKFVIILHFYAVFFFLASIKCFYIHLFGYYTWRWMPQSPQPFFFFFPVCRATLLQKEEPYVTVSSRYHRVKSNWRFLRLRRPLVTKINMAEYAIYEYVSCCKRRDVLVDKSCRRRRWRHRHRKTRFSFGFTSPCVI